MTGLLGRNGAGKTTLMRIITGQEFPSSGDLRVFGETPAENDEVLRRMVFVREEQSYPDFQVRHAIRVASWFYPNWDEDLAQQLLKDFELPPRRRIKRLSRGMRSAVGIVIGLAARADLTLFDEPYAGLDAVARQLEAGTVWINQHINPHPAVPFTGPKTSGLGVQFGPEGLRDFCNLQIIATRR